MARHVLLNNVDHKDLKINCARSAAFGDNVASVLVFPNEFRSVQAHYPIVFSRSPDGNIVVPLALTGLMQGENLFLTDQGWDALYLPLAIEMQPFLIGFTETENGEKQSVIHVDMDSPRVGTVGEPVFLPMGGNTPFLDHVAGVLDRVHAGNEMNTDFTKALDEHELLEPFSLDMEFSDGSTSRLAGFHTINEEKLYALSGEALGDLNEKGYLQPIYMVIASLSNLSALIQRKNARILKGDAG